MRDQGPLQLLPLLLAESSYYSDNELPDEFIQDFIERYRDNGLNEIFTPIYTALAQKIRSSSMISRYMPTLSLMVRLSKFVDLAKILVAHPNWMPILKTGSGIEGASVLGAFFTITAYYDKKEVGEHYFGKRIGTMTKEELQSIIAGLRSEIKTIYDLLSKILLNLLKPKETRDAAIAWLALAVEGNKFRARMQDDMFSSSTEGFMTNLCAVLLRLCEPFMDAQLKNPTIDPDFAMMNTMVNFKEDTHIGSVSEKEGMLSLCLSLTFMKPLNGMIRTRRKVRRTSIS
jgi:ubiquitin conjugation factor E4 B